MPETVTDTLITGRFKSHQKAGDGSGWVQDMGVYARRVDLTVVGQVTTIYKGWAAYGTVNSDPLWRIQRIIIDETVGLVLTDGQAGTGAFNQDYSDRENLSYS